MKANGLNVFVGEFSTNLKFLIFLVSNPLWLNGGGDRDLLQSVSKQDKIVRLTSRLVGELHVFCKYLQRLIY